MILSGKEIEKQLGTNIIIEPFNKSQLNPNSYNLRLHNELVVYDVVNMRDALLATRNGEQGMKEYFGSTPRCLDMKKDNPTQTILIPEDGFVLQPNILYLGRTVEYTTTTPESLDPSKRVALVPLLDGRSSIGRLGINVHATAGFGDIGFSGYWTLEISVIHPVKIYPNVEICQIYYHTVCGDEYEMYTHGKYYENTGIQSSKMFQEFQ